MPLCLSKSTLPTPSLPLISSHSFRLWFCTTTLRAHRYLGILSLFTSSYKSLNYNLSQVGKAALRFVHLSASTEPVDVILKDGPVLLRAVEIFKASQYLLLDAGRYDLEIRYASTDKVLLRVSVTLVERRGWSIFLEGMMDDGSLKAIITED